MGLETGGVLFWGVWQNDLGYLFVVGAETGV